jgi:hypothetical protein
MTDLAARLPWVTRLSESAPCGGLLSHTPLKAVYRMGGRPPAGLDAYRCKNPARWQFQALPSSAARDGIYCWPHLISRCLYGDVAEQARAEQGLAELREPS